MPRPHTDDAVQMRRKILIVDDQPQFAHLLARAMPEYDVCVEGDSLLALTTARNLLPDLFILDLMMPEMDGPLLASNIRNDPRLRNTPILFLSALVHSTEDAVEPVLVEGYPAFGKPFSIEALKRFINQQLSGESSVVSINAQLKNGVIAGQ